MPFLFEKSVKSFCKVLIVVMPLDSLLRGVNLHETFHSFVSLQILDWVSACIDCVKHKLAPTICVHCAYFWQCLYRKINHGHVISSQPIKLCRVFMHCHSNQIYLFKTKFTFIYYFKYQLKVQQSHVHNNFTLVIYDSTLCRFQRMLVCGKCGFRMTMKSFGKPCGVQVKWLWLQLWLSATVSNRTL